MARQGYDLQLTRYDEKGWRATRARRNPSSAPEAERTRCVDHQQLDRHPEKLLVVVDDENRIPRTTHRTPRGAQRPAGPKGWRGMRWESHKVVQSTDEAVQEAREGGYDFCARLCARLSSSQI